MPYARKVKLFAPPRNATGTDTAKLSIKFIQAWTKGLVKPGLKV